MNPETPHPPPRVSSDPELVAFLTATTPRQNIPQQVRREAYTQLAPLMPFISSVAILIFGIALISIVMTEGLSEILKSKGKVGAMLFIAPFFIAAGIWGSLKYFRQRSRCRRLLENGVVDEFQIVDLDIGRQEQGRYERAIAIFDFILKPANRENDRHSYFSRLTNENQINYAKAVRRSKTTTFGLYDPTDTDGKRRVLMVEAWFH